MTEKLRAVRARYDELGQLLQQPGIAADPAQYARLMKEYKSLTPLAEACDAYAAARRAFDGAKELLEEGGLEPELKDITDIGRHNIPAAGGRNKIAAFAEG